MKTTILSILLPFALLTGYSQLGIGGSDPVDLAYNQLTSGNSQISNVTYSGYDQAISYFQANTLGMTFTRGILMTTGNKFLAEGPNNMQNAGVDNGYPGYGPLDAIVDEQSHNASILSFDIVPFGDSIKLEYIFASEEYMTFADSKYKDIVGIFISGPGISGTRNIALLPDDNPVSVGTVHKADQSAVPPVLAVNPGFYVDNGTGFDWPYAGSVEYVQYNGMTKPLTARQKVTAGETYHMTIAIADVGDGIYDSGVFIRGGSLTASVDENHMQASVFPNPVADQLYIEQNGSVKANSYTLSDLSGRIVAQGDIAGNASIDLRGTSTGMYLLNLFGENARTTLKIEKL